MLLFGDKIFIEAPFRNENELEEVVKENYEFLFGPSSIYLPKSRIETSDGKATIPDGFAIDIEQKLWYIVEAELIEHSVWGHIIPQVTKQMAASFQAATKQKIEELVVEQYRGVQITKEKFSDANIREIDVRKVIADILKNDPTIAIPINGIKEDLKQWANTLKHKVKFWIVNKFEEQNNPTNIIYQLPEEFKPQYETVGSEQDSEQAQKEIKQYDVSISDLISSELLTVGQELYFKYGHKSGKKINYTATIQEDGTLLVLEKVFKSPSLAAIAVIQGTGSERKTSNGWKDWKTENGLRLFDLRNEFLERQATTE